ncbi:MAG: DUF547 domain-containing protein [Deltaproteobacteria bacterium]|nr:DUF547 domain-containing protein [Deltaproteobacteria bacterium]
MTALLAALLIGLSVATAAEPAADPWARVLSIAAGPTGEVAYGTLEAGERERLERYLGNLARQDVSRFERDRAVAFWLNAYHALALSALLHGEDPRTLEGRARMYHWFTRPIGGRRRTLDEIRAKLNGYASADPRIHLAIWDGTRSGARLAAEPYQSGRLDAQLAAAARRFVNDPEKLRAPAPGRLEASSVLSWYRSDFEREAGSLVEFLRPLVADPELRRRLATPPTEIVFLPYDWSMAATAGEPAR